MFTKEEKKIIQKAINDLTLVPSDKFITNNFTNNIDSCCAIGHIVRLESQDPTNYSNENCSDLYNDLHPIRRLSECFLNNIHQKSGNLARVNNGDSNLYPQKLPKERSLALLTDMLNAE